ncbi:glycosyltransferase [Limnochorda pilosa]|uniref:Glycosyltransferase family 1 n=1 Tax=Limnochorda pilosa TaxID=1555112 RepID=A0A0K2SHN4_LIMPI|nr:glycosyltransferase [Limnochorda pilosa]BAS26600.1 glycosyltransferase family 1 [Limnochorda pilosa]
MRVALFSDSFREDLGGLTRAVIRLHDGLVARGHTVRVYTLHQRAGPLHPADRIFVPAVPVSWLPWAPPDSWAAWNGAAVYRSLEAWAPDVVHLHSPLPVGWWGLLAARRLGVPVLSTCHANPEAPSAFLLGGQARGKRRVMGESVLSRASRAYQRAFYGRCDAVVAPSPSTASLLRAMGVRRPIHVIPNGVDLSRFTLEPGWAPGAAPPNHPPRVLYAGRLSAEKGVETLLAAVQELWARGVGMELVVAGSGPLEGRVRAWAYRAPGRVTLLGKVGWESMPEVYRSCDLLCLPSPLETEGLAAIEAMASGLPVVGVAEGALVDLVRPGFNGLLATPGDPTGLADALARIVVDPEARRRLVPGALATARARDSQHFLDQLVSLYAYLASTGDAGRERGPHDQEPLRPPSPAAPGDGR